MASKNNRFEINWGKRRRNNWKWSKEIDRLMEYYHNKDCECGCGKKLAFSRKTVRDSKYRKRLMRTLKGHCNRLPEAKKWIKGGKEHPFYGKHHTLESLEKMSIKTRGKKHPCWKDGITKPFPFRRGWAKIRKRVLERDNYTCKKCGVKKESKFLHIHHIVDRRKFQNAEEAHKLDNLILLCKSCHLTLENRKKRKENGVNCKKLQNGKLAAKSKDCERLLKGSTVKTEETIMSTSAPH